MPDSINTAPTGGDHGDERYVLGRKRKVPMRVEICNGKGPGSIYDGFEVSSLFSGS